MTDKDYRVPSEKGRPLTITIVLASDHPEDIQALNAAVTGTLWTFIEVVNCAELLGSIREVQVPIVLLDRDLPGSPWQDTMRILLGHRRGACVILLSAVSSQQLCDEIVRRGGFDVLTRPFEKREVLSMLVLAYTHCRIGLPSRMRRIRQSDSRQRPGAETANYPNWEEPGGPSGTTA
jgi:FixJ family two-component response regulator